MKQLTLAKFGHGLAIILVLLSIGTMAYFGVQYYLDPKPEIANIFTGAGAVLASAVSAIVAFRTVAIVEDSQKPYPYPYIDIKSRYGLSLIKIKNAGGSAAHHVYLEWEDGVPALYQGPSGEARPIHFAGDAQHAISLLMPGEEQTAMLGVHHWVAKQLKTTTPKLKGNVVFQDVKGNLSRSPFFIDTSFYEWAFADETELLKAQRAMTELPEVLSKIQTSLASINQALRSNAPPCSKPENIGYDDQKNLEKLLKAMGNDQ